MRNAIQDGKSIACTAPVGGVLGGQFLFVGSMFGVAVASAAEGDSFELETGGVKSLPKAAGAIAQGADLFYDTAASKLTTNAAGGANKKVGVAAFAALAGDTEVAARLNSSF